MNNLRRIVLAAVLLALILVVYSLKDQLDVTELKDWVDQAGLAGPPVYLLMVALGTVLMLPGSLLAMAGGGLFGPVWGSVYGLAGATLGSVLAFLLTRYLVADWVRAKVGDRGRRIIRGVEAEGWRFVAFMRIAPFVPFILQNYLFGLTRVRLSHYAIATFVFLAPGVSAFAYLGYVGREAMAGGEGLIFKILLALTLLAALAYLPDLVGRLRQRNRLSAAELTERLQRGDIRVLDVRAKADCPDIRLPASAVLNVPLEQLARRIDELGDDPEQAIAVVACAERHARRAASLLTRQGFADVHVLGGGLKAWRRQHDL